MIVNLEKWENNVYYVAYEWEENIYEYVFQANYTNDMFEVEEYSILPDYYEDDEPIFTDEYLKVAEDILNIVVKEFERL